MTAPKEKWSVWRAVVYFEDDPTQFKERPVVILDDRVLLCVSLKVTSKEKNDRFHVRLKQWRAAGLTKPSWVDISKVLEIKEQDFTDEIGKLDIEDIMAIIRGLSNYQSIIKK